MAILVRRYFQGGSVKKFEIERRWLVLGLRDGLPAPDDVFRLEQGYWETPTPAQSVRVRIIDGTSAVITQKTGTGLVREEKEFPVDPDLARCLLETCPHRLEKTRDQMGPWLLDRFSHPLSGIVLLERELESKDEDVRLPAWILRAVQVTDILTSRDLARIATRLRKKGGNPQEHLRRLLAKRA